MRKIIAFLIITVLLILLGIWSPWRNLDFNINSLFGISEQKILSALQVNSLSGTLEVYVDNVLKGEVTPQTSPLFVDQIETGERLIKLVRKSDVPNSYWTFNKLAIFTKGVNVVISYNLGPEEIFSEGNIIYAVDKEDPSKSTTLEIINNVEDFNVQMDSLPIEKISLNEYTSILDLSKQHNVKLIKPGYETLEFSILPALQDDRDKLMPYNLIIESQMMYQPITVEDVVNINN